MENRIKLKACRICLKTSCRLFGIRALGLGATLAQLSGAAWDAPALPRALCAVCAVQLRHSRQLAARARAAHSLLLQVLETKRKITLRDVKNIDCRSILETATLAAVYLTPNHCDLHINKDAQQTELGENVKLEETAALEMVHHVTVEENHDSNDEEELADNKTLIEEIKEEDLNGTKIDEDILESEEPLEKDQNGTNINDDILKSDNCNFVKVKSEDKDDKTSPKPTVKRKRACKKYDVKPIEKERNGTYTDIISENYKLQKLTFEEQKLELEKKKLGTNYIKSPFKCDDCYRGFKAEAVYNAHLKRHTESGGKFECPVCHVRFPRKNSCWKHRQTHESLYSCNRCQHQSQDRLLAVRHINWHRGVVYKCDMCPDSVFEFETSLIRHRRLWHPSPFCCVLCGRGYRDARGLRAHCDLTHSGQPIPVTGPRCEECELTFASDKALLIHQVAQHGQLGNGYSSATKRGRKSTRGDDGTNYTCDKCGESFRNRDKLCTHLRKEHGLPPPRLSAAEKREQLRAFRKQCHVCGKLFSCVATLHDHMDEHDEASSHACAECGKAFKTRARMQTHARGHRHQYACPVCRKTFSTSGNRDRHINYVHKTERDVECRFCSKGFKSNEERRSHELYVHLKKPWPTRVRNRKRVAPPAPASLKAPDADTSS